MPHGSPGKLVIHGTVKLAKEAPRGLCRWSHGGREQGGWPLRGRSMEAQGRRLGVFASFEVQQVTSMLWVSDSSPEKGT